MRGVPTEHPLRAIWTEAVRYASPALVDVGIEKVGRLLDAAHRKGLVTWAALHEMVDDIHQRGRSGTVIMRALAEARHPGSSPTESRNEERDPDLPLAVEINSLTFHTTPSDRRDDEVRYRRLNDAGFTVAVIWEDDLWSHPSEVVRTVVRGRAAAVDGKRIVIHSGSCPWP